MRPGPGHLSIPESGIPRSCFSYCFSLSLDSYRTSGCSTFATLGPGLGTLVGCLVFYAKEHVMQHQKASLLFQ
jgi:hypothetical protein